MQMWMLFDGKKCVLNIWNPATCRYENGKYLASIINSLVICDGFMETTKRILTKNVPKKVLRQILMKKR